jgi:hypothetical protein
MAAAPSMRGLATARPPAEVAWLTDVIGAEAAFILIEQRGGTRVSVPKIRAAGSSLAALVGDEAAAALVRAFGDSTITIPVARYWRVQRYRQQGLSYAAIARMLGCHEDTVWRLLRTGSRESTQLSLL